MSLIPKWVVIVPETDIINHIKYTQHNLAESAVEATYKMILEFLMSKFEELINTYTKQPHLPKRVNKGDWPRIIWIEPSLHLSYNNNDARIKFIAAMHNVVQEHPRTIVLPLKQGWNDANQSFVSVRNILSHRGLQSFWAAVDNATRFADIKLSRLNTTQPLAELFHKDKIKADAETRVAKFKSRMDQRASMGRIGLQPGVSSSNSFNNTDSHHRQEYISVRQRTSSPTRRNHYKGFCKKRLF